MTSPHGPAGAGLAKRWAALTAGGRALYGGTGFLTRLLFRATPRLAVVLFLFILFQAALPVVNVRLTQLIVNMLAAGQGAAVLVGPLVIYVTLLLATAGLTPALNAVQALIHERLIGHVTLLVLSHVNTFTDLSRFEDPTLYNDLRTICQRAPYLPRALLQNSSDLAGALLAGTGLCLLLATLHPLLPLALVASTAPALIMHYQSSRLYYCEHLELEELERRQFYWLGLGTDPGGARDVQLYGIAGWVRDQFARCFHELDRRRWQLRRRLLWRTLAALGLRFAGTGGAFVYLVGRAVSGRLLPGDFVLLTLNFLPGREDSVYAAFANWAMGV